MLLAARRSCRAFLCSIWKKREGMGTIEVVIIVAVLVALALIFKDFILGLAQDLFEKIQSNASSAATNL